MKALPHGTTGEAIKKDVKNIHVKVMQLTQEVVTKKLHTLLEEFDSDAPKETLNLLSFEATDTKLAKKIKAPKVVEDIDLNDLAWPAHLRMKQTNGDKLTKLTFPKIQK